MLEDVPEFFAVGVSHRDPHGLELFIGECREDLLDRPAVGLGNDVVQEVVLPVFKVLLCSSVLTFGSHVRAGSVYGVSVSWITSEVVDDISECGMHSTKILKSVKTVSDKIENPSFEHLDNSCARCCFDDGFSGKTQEGADIDAFSVDVVSDGLERDVPVVTVICNGEVGRSSASLSWLWAFSDDECVERYLLMIFTLFQSPGVHLLLSAGRPLRYVDS